MMTQQVWTHYKQHLSSLPAIHSHSMLYRYTMYMYQFLIITFYITFFITNLQNTSRHCTHPLKFQILVYANLMYKFLCKDETVFSQY